MADWMHRTIGGIAPLEPGYAKVRIAPRPGGGLTWCTTSLETRHGMIEVRWHVEDGTLTLNATLPEGVSGVLALEGQPDVTLTGGAPVLALPADLGHDGRACGTQT